MNAQDGYTNDPSLSKLVRLYGAERAEALVRDTLREIGIGALRSPDDRMRFGTALLKKGGLLEAIGRAIRIQAMPADRLWWRPNEQANSVGNLLLHLTGNVRQWILCGLGGETDRRDRAGEFAATGTSERRSAAELMARLQETVAQAVAVVERLGPEELLARRSYQGRYEETGVAAVLHVMEHFSGHAGQIYAHTKQGKGVDLKHYDL